LIVKASVWLRAPRDEAKAYHNSSGGLTSAA
jgi:hypothetical protein